jgi:hypothetical protein
MDLLVLVVLALQTKDMQVALAQITTIVAVVVAVAAVLAQ